MKARHATSSPLMTALAAIFLALTAGVSRAAEPSQAAKAPALALELSPESRLWLRGDSTLHAYASTATVVRVSAEIAPPPPGAEEDFASAVRDGRVQALEVVIPVAGLRSGEKGLDKNLYAALKAPENAEIRYRLARYERSPAGARGASTLKSQGRLSVAGKERAVSIDVEARESGTAVHLRGSYPLLMSDYGVKPPAFMLGVLKVRDPVTVFFELEMGFPKRTQERRGL